jgi:hypothetical protein
LRGRGHDDRRLPGPDRPHRLAHADEAADHDHHQATGFHDRAHHHRATSHHHDDDQHDLDPDDDRRLGRWIERRHLPRRRVRREQREQRRDRKRLGSEQRRQAVGRLLPRQLLRLAPRNRYFFLLGTKYAQ